LIYGGRDGAGKCLHGDLLEIQRMVEQVKQDEIARYRTAILKLL
jgi:hypothetical protein